MSKLMKKSALMTVILGGVMFQLGGCFSGQWRWVWAILQEDIFG
jgi:hypothetical protein